MLRKDQRGRIPLNSRQYVKTQRSQDLSKITKKGKREKENGLWEREAQRKATHQGRRRRTETFSGEFRGGYKQSSRDERKRLVNKIEVSRPRKLKLSGSRNSRVDKRGGK